VHFIGEEEEVPIFSVLLPDEERDLDKKSDATVFSEFSLVSEPSSEVMQEFLDCQYRSMKESLLKSHKETRDQMLNKDESSAQ